ncbi:helix-turn-helix transcriptional regulator [Vibrio alginolyticus]
MRTSEKHTSETDRIISRAKFRALTGISRTTEWRLSQKGILPELVVIDGIVLGYKHSSYMLWLESNTIAA